ncbi:MAG: maltokinase N-terminal cap-like domain-containing protein [Candidatus Limnocylindria bacterium]
MIPLTGAWLASQRWFRAKQRPIATVTQLDSVTLGPGELGILEVAYADGGTADHYLVPTVGGHDPADGEGAWSAIVRAMADGAEIQGERGRFACSRTDALDELLPSAHEAAMALGERRLGVEQSNTSIVLGERLILKLYRLLEPGESPDLEVSAFLTDAGFADTPAVAGAMTYTPDGGEPAAAAMLQSFVPSIGDAWAAMFRALADDPDRGLEIAAAVGVVTAAMHAALASRPGAPAFPARAATVAETAAWRASAERQLSQAVTALSGEPHDRLVALAPAVTARFADTFGSATGEARVTRIHGDYHLGQLLARTHGGFSVIDFEGEPARPLAERRQPGSPLRDVAGMLRSLDYAARSAQRTTQTFDADHWLREARNSFIGAYGGIGPSELSLVEAFELEKACYEVRYEANNRPDWLWLPLSAVEQLTMRAS